MMRRSALLLAGHRMPSYREAVLARAGKLTHVQSSAGADVVLSSTLAPQLAAVTASALHPPLPPPQLSGPTAAGWLRPQAKSSMSGPWQWLPKGTGHSQSGGTPPSVRLRVSIGAPEDPAVLHSITSARLRQPGRASLPMRWVAHVGTPPVQADLAETAVSTNAQPARLRPWLTSVLSRTRWQQPQQQQPAEQRSVLEILLPTAQARQLLAQPQVALKLRSDFTEAAVTVQMRRQLLWVLGGSAHATARLLLPSVTGAASSATASDAAQQAAAAGHARWSGSIWPWLSWSATVAQPASGKLAIGLDYLHFSSATARLDQLCATLLQLLQQQPAAASTPEDHGTAHPALWQGLLASAARMVRMPNSASRMLHAEQLPQLLFCIISPQDSQLHGISRACAAAAAAGIGVLIAVSPQQADTLTTSLEQYCTSGWAPVVLRLRQRDDAVHTADAINVLEQLSSMMLRTDARSSATAATSRL
jgi:hypothetical protein